MRLILATAVFVSFAMTFGIGSAMGQQLTGSRAPTTSGSGAALTQTGTVLGASDFGGAGMGSNLRSATVGGMMGMNNAGMNMMGMNAMGMGGMNRMGMGGMGMGGMGMGGMGGMQGQGSTPALKIPIRLGDGLSRSTPFASATPVRAARFERRLTKLRGVNTGSGVQVEVRAGVAMLTGTVPTDRDREMIAQLALLEPGIEKIENELKVDPTSDLSEETLPVSGIR